MANFGTEKSKMHIKTKAAQKILEPVKVQVDKLKQLATNDCTKSNVHLTKSVFCEQLHALSEKFDELSKEKNNDYQGLKAKITLIVEEFCSTNDIDKFADNIDSHTTENALEVMLDKFVLTLRMLENLECLPLKQRLQDCLDYVKEMGTVCEIEDFQNAKELGTSILEIFGPLQRYRKSLISYKLSERIALYSCQLITAFNLLVELIKEQHQLNAPIYECKKYVCGRICTCFEMIMEVLDDPNPQPAKDVEKENHFIYRMDLILDLIADIPKKAPEEQKYECSQLWLGIEDVFSHAMAIAQVCQPFNFKAITGACQSIMSEYDNLKVQLHAETPDPSLNNLFINTLTDALYRLERKVNISVLSLVMEVFGDPFGALRKLVMSCGNSLTAEKRSRSDLSNSIEEFDQLTDKTIQIGMFAIACCKDVNRVNQIKNCLASFESLETELVSSITAFYLHPDNKEMRANVKLLTTQWQAEMNKLHNTVDVIIDSAAYCQVILDDMQEKISIMSDCLDNRQPVTQLHVQGIVQRAVSLSSQLTATVNDIGSENIERHTIMMIRELKAAIFEADAASKSLLIENATEPQQLRVIKRCELILNVVKRLQPALEAIMNDSILMNTNYKKSGIGQGDMLHGLSFPSNIYGLPRDEKSTYIRTPYTVKNYKSALTIQPANSVPRTESDLSSLMPYIKRGRQMRTEQSVMYKTPQKVKDESDECTTDNKLNTRNLVNVRQHLFSRDSFVSCSDIDLSAESMDLTSILEKISTLSISVDSSTSGSCFANTPNLRSEGARAKSIVKLENWLSKKVRGVPGLCLSNLSDLSKSPIPETPEECSVIGGGDAPSTIETPDRFQDIRQLEKKIETLQKQMFKQ